MHNESEWNSSSQLPEIKRDLILEVETPALYSKVIKKRLCTDDHLQEWLDINGLTLKRWKYCEDEYINLWD